MSTLAVDYAGALASQREFKQHLVEWLPTLKADAFVLPASVYAEVLIGPMRHGPQEVASLEQFIADFAMQIIPLTPDIARHAASLRARTPSLRLPDAFVLATGDSLGVGSVLTGDAAWLKFSPRAVLI